MHIIYPRLATSTNSTLLESAIGGKAGDSVSALALKSANKVLKFQSDYSDYLWGNNDSDGEKKTLDLTGANALEQITKLVKPKLLKSTRQSGATLILTGKLNTRQLAKVDSLMNT